MYAPEASDAAITPAASVAAAVAARVPLPRLRHADRPVQRRGRATTGPARYPLSKDGRGLDHRHVNGRVDVEGADGSTVEVQAERIAHAATDQLAAGSRCRKSPSTRGRRPIGCTSRPGRISGILIGASFEVRYHVKVPKGATVRASTVTAASR